MFSQHIVSLFLRKYENHTVYCLYMTIMFIDVYDYRGDRAVYMVDLWVNYGK